MIDLTVADLALGMKGITDGFIEGSLSVIEQRWLEAWEELVGDWEPAVDELTAMSDAGEWPSRGQINRSIKAQRALDATSDALNHLSRELLDETDLADMVALARKQQHELIAAQVADPKALQGIRRDYDARAVAEIIKRSQEQVTSLAWTLEPEATAAMKSALIRGVAVGESPRTAAAAMVKRVQGAFNGGKARALNIARTEMIDAHRLSAQQTQNQYRHLLSGWRWTAALDASTCIACLDMAGQEFPLDEAGPLGHPSCRCARTPVVAELYSDLPEVDMQWPPTGQEWFAQQDEATQLKIMGPKRFAAYQEGTFPPGTWAVRRENPAWRASYGVGSPGATPKAEAVVQDRWWEEFDGPGKAPMAKDDDLDWYEWEENFQKDVAASASYEGWSEYTKGDYRLMNSYLRSGGETLATPWDKENIVELDRAFDGKYVRTVKESGHLLRGVQSWPDAVAGDTIVDLGFLSMTSDPWTAANFGDSGYVIVAKVQKGARYIPGTDHEAEFIFRPGTAMKVVHREGKAIYVELIP